MFQFILLHSFHGMQLFSARGAILLSTEWKPLLEDEDENDDASTMTPTILTTTIISSYMITSCAVVH